MALEVKVLDQVDYILAALLAELHCFGLSHPVLLLKKPVAVGFDLLYGNLDA